MGSLRVMVFYDGNYFKQGNIYFRYKEERGWFNLAELHAVLERFAAARVKTAPDITRVVAAHYYDGRTSANATVPEALEKERAFEMSLLRTGIVPHYLPVRETLKPGHASDEQRFTFVQKGVDVELAIDVLDLAHSNRFDVAVLITGDEDFVPLVRRIESLGKHILLAHFAFEAWTDKNGKTHRSTFTSRALQDAASWCLNFNRFVTEPEHAAELKALFQMPQSQAPPTITPP